MLQALTNYKKPSPPRATHLAIKGKTLTNEQIGSLIVCPCRQSRNSYSCPNNHDCGKSLFQRKGGSDELFAFRAPYWASGWKNHLSRTLANLSAFVEGDNSRVITFVISGSKVCKSFFRASTGLSRQVFDAAVQMIEAGSSNVALIESPIKVKTLAGLSNSAVIVCGFLDAYFTGFRVQHDPTNEDKLMLHKTWKKLYNDDFVEHCSLSGACLVSYCEFCRIRKQHRKNYKINKTYRRKS